MAELLNVKRKKKRRGEGSNTVILKQSSDHDVNLNLHEH